MANIKLIIEYIRDQLTIFGVTTFAVLLFLGLWGYFFLWIAGRL